MILLRSRCQRTNKSLNSKMRVHRDRTMAMTMVFWLMAVGCVARNASSRSPHRLQAQRFSRNNTYFYSIEPVLIQPTSPDEAIGSVHVHQWFRSRSCPIVAEDRSLQKMILLLLSGIERNPGPFRTSGLEPRSGYPCGICYRECEWEQHALACDGCNQWCHRKCTGYSIFEYYELKKCEDSWLCPRCTKRQKEMLSRLSKTRKKAKCPEMSEKRKRCASKIKNSEFSATSNSTHCTVSESSTEPSTSCTTSSNSSEGHTSEVLEVQGLPEEQNELNEHADTLGAPSGTSDDQQDSDSDSDKDLVATISAGDVPRETDSSSPALVTKTLSASYSSDEIDEDDITTHQSLPLNQRTQIPSHQGKVYY